MTRPLTDLRSLTLDYDAGELREARHVTIEPSFLDRLAEGLRDPVSAYLLGIGSGASATVIFAAIWAVFQ